MAQVEFEISARVDRELTAFLDDRLYEFNVAATGCDDGELLSAAVRDDAGGIVAGISGLTWGGCCVVHMLWVHESLRGQDVGTRLMQAAETEARRRGCAQFVLSTHSFQAPAFYEKLGFVRHSSIDEYPRGHANVTYIKRLGPVRE